jgi:DNA-directed RNA polymerase I, II, and III subunit RPABC2
MSYFDETDINGGDASDDENKDDDSETETNIDEDDDDGEEDDGVQQLSDDDDDVAEGKDDDEGEEGDESDEVKKIEYKEKYGIDLGSNDDEDIIEFARRHLAELRARYGKDFGEDEEDDLKIYGRKYLEEMKEKEGAVESESDTEPDTPKKKTKKIPGTKQKVQAIVYDEEDDEDPTGEVYLQKFDKEINDNYLVNVHPESAVHNYDEILAMTKVVRDKNGIIIDDLHKTIPFLTKYEKARVLGQRAKQINSGATVFVKVPEKVIDGYLIAELELIEKRVPFIIRRPLPNGGSEYWSIKDLENISF